MIRLDQRSLDVQGTERVFKKVVHSGQNAIRFVDKDGVPMRVPNTAALSRLHSTYTLSPRGVPTRKSNHSYSGQLTQAKMQNMVSSLDTTSQEMSSYPSMHSYGNGLSSAGSSRHYISTANSQKRRSFGPPRSVKSMAKSASTQRSQRMLVSAPGPDLSVEPELENTNESPQGKRLEKEWSALSQCRALKRSSEIVSHRVDRMYFMSGNKLNLQSKYHVEDKELRHLRDLQAARASSRASRSGQSRKGDIYRPHLSARSQQAGLSNGDAGTVVVSDEAKRNNRLAAENGHKENRDPQVLVTQKTLTARQHSVSKSPIQGWAGEDQQEKDSAVANGVVNDTALHDNVQGNDEEEFKGQNVFVTNAIENGDSHDQGNDDIGENNGDDKKENKHTEKDVEKIEQENEVTEKIEKLEIVTDGKMNDDAGKKGEKGNDDSISVHKTEETSESSDKDKTEVKTEDYLGK
ncbi:uncharacterized protein LOC123548508 isoform X2 [Mercenaria mercenaria]|uniref:uncharacterized protein LOC123548508 isoform X2 n=1 Tax=Mercenaria mercenaria TaxID=6596 RepID=UPI001E1E11F3|nr:uncharacterized protein LOC123548508 isoform X2 [Mercenaria mercenaria]